MAGGGAVRQAVKARATTLNEVRRTKDERLLRMGSPLSERRQIIARIRRNPPGFARMMNAP
jgi:hypothetical protein